MLRPRCRSLLVQDSGAQPTLSSQEQQPQKLVALFLLACEVFLNLADLGAQGLDLDAERVSEVAGRAMISAQRLSIKRIGGLTATLGRWKLFRS